MGAMKTAAVLLAAGLSTRMGTPKMLIPWEGRPVVRVMAKKFLSAGVDHVLVVTGEGRTEVENSLRGLRVRTVFNPRFREDMATSVKTGVEALPVEVDFLFITPADHPWLSVTTVTGLLDAARANPDQAIFQPVFESRGGHPLGLRVGASGIPPLDLRREILSAPAGWTLRDLLRKHVARLLRWPCQDPGCVRDLDTPEDLML
jgi:CTP:molybdopterin cytidylyltransferase MocA